MTSPRIAFFAMAVATLAGCTSDPSGSPKTHTAPPQAYVRYYNAVGDTLPLDFRPIDRLDFSTPFIATPFRAQGLGGYQGWAPGARHLRVFPNSTDLATTTSILIDTTVTLTAQTYYTFTQFGYARTGGTPAQGLWITQDTIPTVGAGNVAVRVTNLASTLGNVDIYITTAAGDPLPGTPTFAAVPFKTQTAYVERTAGPLVIRVYAAGDVTTALVTATMSAGTPATADFSAIGGSGQAGTAATAMLYSPATPGSAAEITAGSRRNTTPGIYYWIDKQP